jgi:serine O-acetyltransferase
MEKTMIDYKEKIKSVAEKICSVDEAEERYFGNKVSLVPDRKAIIRIIKLVQSVMFPEYFKLEDSDGKSIEERLDDVFCALKRQISACYAFAGIESIVDTESVALSILERIPQIKASLIKDIQAIYEGDPAAKSPEEIILCYPGFYAISIYRLAHEFYERKIPFISRIMTEFAHEKTGIDIHAGAKIGERFFIDHGTGIVIGETTTIGDNVKVYQGVTLGAKSFEVGEDGNPIKGIKRHPDIGNNCVIYANATILGGKTVIGDGSVIGASVWLTSSVAPGSVVYYGNNVKEMGKNG